MIKRVYYYKIVILMIFLVFALALALTPRLTAFASSDTLVAFESLTVESDLEGMGFKLEDYPKDENGEVALFAFMEYGFSEYENVTENYNLYFYVYNPREIEFDFNSIKNRVQIGTSFDENGAVNDYEKFALKLVNKSETGRYLKLKVNAGLDIIHKSVIRREERRYIIPGIELFDKEKLSADDYSIATTFIFSGYAKGYAIDTEAESTLSCRTEKLETIELEVNHTSYKVYNTDNTTGQELATVYFNVPDRYFNEYGKLQQIKAEWLYSVTDYIYCTWYDNLYDELFNNLGKSGSDISGLRYFLYSKFENNASTRTGTYYDAYNFKDPMVTGYSYNVESTIDQINWVMRKNVANYDELCIPSEELLDFYKNNKEIYNLLTYEDESRTTKVIDAGDKYDLKGLAADHSYWTWLWEYLGFTHTVEEITPIYIVKTSDLLLSKEDFANTLKVNVNDVDDIKSMVKEIGSKTVLFRFALNNFEDQKLFVGLNRNEQNYADFPSNNDKIIYRTKLPLYQYFDIIWLGFLKEDKLTIIPAVSNPITVMGSTQPPLFNEDKDRSFGAFLKSMKDLFKNRKNPNKSGCDDVKQALIIVAGVLVGVLVLLLVLKVISWFKPVRFKVANSSSKRRRKKSKNKTNRKKVIPPKV